MIKYYTRACNFYYGNISKEKVKKKINLPLNGNQLISFDTIELITRKTKKKIKIKDIKKLPLKIKKKVLEDLNKIIKRKYFSTIKFKKIPLLMGILNATPDSFSDGGKYLKSKSAYKQINQLDKDGADIVDIGGESTRPNSNTVDNLIEWNRIKSKLKYAKKKKIIVSLDTRKSFILKKSLPLKINLLNDVSGLTHDSEMIYLLKVSKIPFVLHHMQGTPKTMQKNPKYKNVILDIYDFFEKKLAFIRANKINHNNIILDPGIGFGKNLDHNLRIMSKISTFHSLGCPILIGTSRKRFIEHIVTKFDTPDRTGGTIGSVLYGLLQGVQLFRVHNVKEINQGILVFNKILNTN